MNNKAQNKNARIANLQVILSFFVVLIHSSTIFINLPGQDTQYVYGPNFSTFIQIFIGDGIARIAVPMFFIISGYLFYKNYDGTFNAYKTKLKKRLCSLVIPYLFWSTFTFLAFFTAQKIPQLSSYFATLRTDNLSFKFIWDNVIAGSFNSPLWYCRYLIVFSLISFVFYFAAEKIPVILLSVSFIFWFLAIPLPFGIRTEAIFFFSLGTVIALKTDYVKKFTDILSSEKRKKYFTAITFILWIAVLSFRSVYYCYQNPSMMLDGNYDRVVIFTNNAGIISGICAFSCLYDYMIKNKNKIWKLSEYSFFIFVTHHPVVNIIKKLFIKVVGVSELTTLAAFFAAPLISVGIILLIGIFIKKFINPLWKLVTGGR